MGKVTIAPSANRQGWRSTCRSSTSSFDRRALRASARDRHRHQPQPVRRDEQAVGALTAGLPTSPQAQRADEARRSALITVGMPAAKARRVDGGLFNIGGYQIIFNSMIGGNHFNHLHVGLRGAHQG
jgi:hypothetical protein